MPSHDDLIEDNLLLPHEVNRNRKVKITFLHKIKNYLVKNWKVILLLFVILLLISCTIIIPISILRNKTKNLSSQCDEHGKKIVESALKGTEAYSRLATMCTLFGNRLSGTQALEDTIDWIQTQMINDGLENVHTDNVSVTHWVRGNENAYMLAPYYKKLNMLGLGGSISTNGVNITAPVLVVNSFDELDQVQSQAKGKIVLFNAVFTNYSSTVQYRASGAIAAAKYGAVASLIRSVTPYSLGTPHTGSMHYQDGVTQIPAAAITLEDADLIQGLVNFNKSVTIQLYMEAQTLPNAISRNVMGEITGSEFPEQVVVIGGHIDSWDVGQGAMDDGGGVMVSWEAVRLIKALGIKPKRTIRVVAWTNEENGAAGGQNYAALYANETFFSIETDGGATTPLGFTVSSSSKTLSALSTIAEHVLKPIGSTSITEGEVGTDNSFLVDAGVPGAQLVTNMTQYFWFHHSEGDAIDKMDPAQMDECVGTMAAMALCIANFNGDLPK